MDQDYYQEIIIGHHKNPVGFMKLKEVDVFHRLSNQQCADEFTVSLKYDKEIVAEIGIQGQGCAISRASASIMTSLLKGQSIKGVKALLPNFLSAFEREVDLLGVLDCDEVRALLIVKDNPAKRECALLPWVAFNTCLNINE